MSLICETTFSRRQIDGTESKNAEFMLQSMVKDTIYVIRTGNKIEARFYGDTRVLTITYLPLVNYGYWKLAENTGDTSEDSLDEFFADEIAESHVDKVYHVEFEEFQISIEQLSDAAQSNNQ